MNACIEYYQIRQSESIVQGFLNLIPQNCNVLRDGSLKESRALNLVPGDLVFIRMGDKIPADVVIVHATDLKVNSLFLSFLFPSFSSKLTPDNQSDILKPNPKIS